MSTTPSGCVSLAMKRVRDMIAQCTEFQTWTGAADATAADAYLYYARLPLQNEKDDTGTLAYHVSLRPFCLLYNDVFELRPRNRVSGTVHAWFEQNVLDSATYDGEEAELDFANTIGKILVSEDNSNPGLFELNNQQGWGSFNRIEIVEWSRTTEEEAVTFGDAQICVMAFEWGVV